MKNLLRRAAARIAENEFWLLWVYGVPFLLSSNLPPPVFYASLATIPLFWLVRRTAQGAWSVRTPLDVPLGLLLTLGLVGVAVSNDFATSAHVYGEWIAGMGLYYGIVNSVTGARLKIVVWVLLGLAFGMGVVGLLGLNFTAKFLPAAIYALLPKLNLESLNPRGFAPNIVAGALAPVVPLAAVWALTRRGWLRVGLAIGALFLLGVVILTQSRGALLGLVGAFGILSVWRVPRLVWAVPIVVVAAVAAIFYFGPRPLAEFILVSDSTGSAGGRLELWDRALRMFQDFPFTGIGLGTFEPTVFTMYPLFQNAPGAPAPHAHNLYLQMGVDFGVGGFVAFLGLVTTALSTAFWNLRRADARPAAVLAVGLLASYAAFLLHGLLDAVAVSTKVSIIIWLMLALIAAQANRAELTP